MKDRTYILALIIILSSCNNQKGNEEAVLKSYIGVNEFRKLQSFMNTMEIKFMDSYEVDNINDAYNSYTINKVLGDSHLKFNETDCHSLQIIEESGLVDKYVNLKYDTVYQEDNLVIAIHKKDTTWLLKTREKNKGEYLDKIRKDGFRNYVHFNELYEGLKFATNGDTLIMQIVETREQMGYLNSEKLTERIHLKRVNYEDQFLYRVLICMESYLNELKEYGC